MRKKYLKETKYWINIIVSDNHLINCKILNTLIWKISIIYLCNDVVMISVFHCILSICVWLYVCCMYTYIVNKKLDPPKKEKESCTQVRSNISGSNVTFSLLRVYICHDMDLFTAFVFVSWTLWLTSAGYKTSFFSE